MITILGWIFLAIIAIWVIAHLVIYFVNFFAEDKYRGLTIDTFGWWNTIDGWYIIPTISIDFGRYTEITFRWLIASYCIEIHPVTEGEDDLIAEVRIEQNKKKHEK